MRLRVTRQDRRFAADLYRRYCAKEGSDNIAGDVALAYLSAALRTFRPRRVLEIGAGIGTMTDALLSHDVGVEHVASTEHNAFCLNALASNLSHHDPSRFRIISDEAGFDDIDHVDMIIGDGSRWRRVAWRKARPGVPVFVEGNRIGFREQCREAFAAQGLSITFEEFGAKYGFKLRWRGRLPRLKWRKLDNGCWLGIAKELPAVR